jgi:hypothetical protein
LLKVFHFLFLFFLWVRLSLINQTEKIIKKKKKST